jgi:transcriptional regulator with XRE-family HTH domain
MHDTELAYPAKGSAHRSRSHRVDLHVGAMIRRRRNELKISQEGLATSLGLTFQQIQKYERAVNRVSASRLWEISRVLGVRPAYFFDGANGSAANDRAPSPPAESQFLSSAEGDEIAHAFPRVPQECQQQLIALVRALASLESREALRKLVTSSVGKIG